MHIRYLLVATLLLGALHIEAGRNRSPRTPRPERCSGRRQQQLYKTLMAKQASGVLLKDRDLKLLAYLSEILTPLRDKAHEGLLDQPEFDSDAQPVYIPLD